MITAEQKPNKKDLDKTISLHGKERSHLVQILQELRNDHIQIDEHVMQIVADYLEIPAVEVYGVTSFYPFLDEQLKGKHVIRLGRSMFYDQAANEALAESIQNNLGITFGETTPDGFFSLNWSDCPGLCDQSPVLLIDDQVYTRVKVEDIPEILQFLKSNHEKGKQMPPSVLPHSHHLPLSLDDIEENTGLVKTLEKQPESLLDDWVSFFTQEYGCTTLNSLLTDCPNEIDTIICNGDQSGPGSFLGRVLLSDYPHLIFNGMVAAAHATGAHQGILFLPGEYIYLRSHLENTLLELRQKLLSGRQIAGKPAFDFEIEIRMGAGAYEGRDRQTLIDCLAGFRCEPGNSNEYEPTAESNFVENASFFARFAAFISSGKTQKDRLLFSISGDCARPGIYEVTTGTSLQQILDMCEATETKAVQVGGIFGQCLPANRFGYQINRQDIEQDAALIIYGKERNMRITAENLLEYFAENSCGLCTPCRVGNRVLLDGLRKMMHNSRPRTSLQELISIAETVQLASKCSFGQSAPNAFLSIMEYFPQG